MENNEFTMAAMQIIASSGAAKSMFIEAIDKAIAGEIEEANKALKEGRDLFVEGHQVHAKLLSNCANGFIQPDLLLVHAQDQMSSAETIEIIASKIILMYQINFNLPDFDDLLTYRALYDYVNAHYVAGKENFVFIDEVQMCEDFEKAVNGLHASEKYDIYITGSNAFLLSSDLATLFTGRTFEIKVYPFSFGEYMEYFGLKDRYEALDKYVLEGGMSGSYLYKDQEAKYDYIADVAGEKVLEKKTLAISALNASMQTTYVCPHCHKFLGLTPYEVLKANRYCPGCGVPLK